MGFLDSLMESIMGKAVNLPVCSFLRRKPIRVVYRYYERKPGPHCLLFLTGRRARFQIVLPHYGQSILQICSLLQNQEYQKGGGEDVFSFWPRLAIRLAVGSIISCRNILAGPQFELNSSFCDVSRTYDYRFAYCRHGMQETIVLVSSHYSKQRSPYRTSRKIEYNWLKLSLEEFRQLVLHLHEFVRSKEFSEVEKIVGAEGKGMAKAEML